MAAGRAAGLLARPQLAPTIRTAARLQTGTLLYILARTHGARSVVEFGTSFGVSLIHLAAAVEDNGGGIVVGTEFEPTKVAATRASVEAVVDAAAE